MYLRAHCCINVADRADARLSTRLSNHLTGTFAAGCGCQLLDRQVGVISAREETLSGRRNLVTNFVVAFNDEGRDNCGENAGLQVCHCDERQALSDSTLIATETVVTTVCMHA
jgi:hypothetical protein